MSLIPKLVNRDCVLGSVLSKRKGTKRCQAWKIPGANKAICYKLKKNLYYIILYKSKIYIFQIKIGLLEN